MENILLNEFFAAKYKGRIGKKKEMIIDKP